MATQNSNLVGIFLVRWLVAAVLVFATYNPTPYSFVTYILSQVGTPALTDNWALKALITIGLIIGWWIFVSTAQRTMGWIAVAVAAMLALAAYLAITQIKEWGYDVSNDVMIYVVLAIVSFLLGVGSTASIGKRRWAGIQDTTDDDTNG